TPMQWTGGWNAGFSAADAAALYFPIIVDPPYGFQGVNVMAQERTQTSLLRWMRRIIKVRQQHQAFGRGGMEMLLPENRGVLAFLRTHGDEVILCVNNLSRFVQPVEINLQRFCDWTPVEMIGNIEFPVITERPYFLSLGPHTFYWFRLERPADARGAGGGE
ncbi:MAG TPA: alpha-glucosidase C-terminal domain-containing protein, partial [Gemmatimonadaceae bacterium]|nr:alpha-glucosidase C-terminal domain-containing protein [Gemmatimonadaceae bacterium]